jgi:predicted transcriptional regulator
MYLRFPGLRERRTALMLGRSELAGKAGLSCNVVYALERGGMAKLSSVRRLLKAMGLPLDSDLGPPGPAGGRP